MKKYCSFMPVEIYPVQGEHARRPSIDTIEEEKLTDKDDSPRRRIEPEKTEEKETEDENAEAETVEVAPERDM